MILASPYLLLLLLAVPVVAVLGYVRRRSKASILYSSTKSLREIRPSLMLRLRHMLPALRCLALALIIVALARPQRGQELVVVPTKGIAIEMVVDTSSSMLAQDMKFGGRPVNRLDAVKRVFRKFIAGEDGLSGRPNDVIGMVTFARYPDARCPLTLDHGVLLQLIDDTKIVEDPKEDGTAIGEALALAVERIKETKRKSRVVILLTDGENNAGNADPVETARIAKAFGVKTYTIGAGTTGYAPFPVKLRSGETILRRVPVSIDERTLKEIAKITGGKYFRATDGDSLEKIYKEIDKMEKTKTESVKYLDYNELFPYLLFPGLALIVIEHVLVCTRFRQVP